MVRFGGGKNLEGTLKARRDGGENEDGENFSPKESGSEGVGEKGSGEWREGMSRAEMKKYFGDREKRDFDMRVAPANRANLLSKLDSILRSRERIPKEQSADFQNLYRRCLTEATEEGRARLEKNINDRIRAAGMSEDDFRKFLGGQ